VVLVCCFSWRTVPYRHVAFVAASKLCRANCAGQHQSKLN
jgi:hypothetical protein